MLKKVGDWNSDPLTPHHIHISKSDQNNTKIIQITNSRIYTKINLQTCLIYILTLDPFFLLHFRKLLRTQNIAREQTSFLSFLKLSHYFYCIAFYYRTSLNLYSTPFNIGFSLFKVSHNLVSFLLPYFFICDNALPKQVVYGTLDCS